MKLSERNAEMKAFFDEKADGYDAVHLPMMANKAAITEALPADTARVLDLGGGTGLELIPFFARFSDARVTVIDLSEPMMAQIAERPFADRVTCVAGDFFAVDYGCGYDAVISSAALHHFTPEHKAMLYQKIFEALKEGGMFVNSDRFANDEAEQEACFAMLTDPTVTMRHIDTPLTPACECGVLEDVGFSQAEVNPLEDPRYQLLVAVK